MVQLPTVSEADTRDTLGGRISAIKPKNYTRMGVTIRHLSHLLNEVQARFAAKSRSYSEIYCTDLIFSLFSSRMVLSNF